MRVHCLSALILAGLVGACTKTPQASQTEDILGTNAAGQKSSLTLVPVHNITAAKLPTAPATNAGSDLRRAVTAFSKHFFVMAECSATTGANGQPVAAESLTKTMDRLSESDLLAMNADRQFVTSSTDADVVNVGKKVGNFYALPCVMVGDREISWDEMDNMDERIKALPAQQPTGAQLDADQRLFLVKQTMYLAMRGNYSTNAAKQDLAKFHAVMTMVAEARQINLDPVSSTVIDNLKAGDAFYNPCVTSDEGAYAYMQAWKKQNFACVPTADKEVFAYAPPNYESVKSQWTAEIAATHKTILGLIAAQPVVLPHLGQLLDLISSSTPWAQRSDIGALAQFLATGQPVAGFDYASYFGASDVQKNPNAAPTTALALTGGSVSATSQLGTTTPVVCNPSAASQASSQSILAQAAASGLTWYPTCLDPSTLTYRAATRPTLGSTYYGATPASSAGRASYVPGSGSGSYQVLNGSVYSGLNPGDQITDTDGTSITFGSGAAGAAGTKAAGTSSTTAQAASKGAGGVVGDGDSSDQDTADQNDQNENDDQNQDQVDNNENNQDQNANDNASNDEGDDENDDGSGGGFGGGNSFAGGDFGGQDSFDGGGGDFGDDGGGGGDFGDDGGGGGDDGGGDD